MDGMKEGTYAMSVYLHRTPQTRNDKRTENLSKSSCLCVVVASTAGDFSFSEYSVHRSYRRFNFTESSRTYGPNSVEIVIISVRIWCLQYERSTGSVYHQKYQPLSLPSFGVEQTQTPKKWSKKAKHWNVFSNARSNVCAAHVIARLCIGRRCRARRKRRQPTSFFFSHSLAPRLRATHAHSIGLLNTDTVGANATTCTQPNTRTSHWIEYRSLYCCIPINEMSVIKTVLLWSNVFVGSLVYYLIVYF